MKYVYITPLLMYLFLSALYWIWFFYAFSEIDIHFVLFEFVVVLV